MKHKILNILVMLALLLGATLPLTASKASEIPPINEPPKVIFLVVDGMRQDKLHEYFTRGLPEDMQDEFWIGAMAEDDGLLTQAPPNTGTGWYTLMTGAWAAVHGSTNNTFAKNGGSGSYFQSSRVAAFDAGVLSAETIGQAAERAGKKVVQFEFAGSRNGAIDGPTIDYRNFYSGRGVVTNYISPADYAPFVSSFGLQFDHPAGFAGNAPYPEAAPASAAGWTNVPVSFSPAMQMFMRVIDYGTDKYGMNVYIFDSTDDGVVNYDMVLFSPDKDGTHAVAVLKEGQWGDVKVKIVGGSMAGKTAGFLIKVEKLAPDLSMVRLFHSSVARAIASWPGFPGVDGITDFEEYIAVAFPSSTAADYAILESGIVSEDTYVEQGLYWGVFAKPVLEYLLSAYPPDLALIGVPTVDEFQHQFMGLVTPTLPNGQPNPAYDDVNVDGVQDGLVAERNMYLESAYREAAEVYVTVRKYVNGNLNTFVSSDHGFAAQFLAIDASKVLVDLGLLSKPQTSNCRTASGETIGSAKACWAGGTVQIYLNVVGRDPAPASGSTIKQIKAADVAATVDLIKAAFLGLVDPNDWTHDGLPEGWMVIDRAFTKAESRYIPNGPGSTTNMAHPTRTGDLVVFAYPPYQFDAATPGTLYALSMFYGQHGYVPDVQVLEANINMRAAFLAAGRAIIPHSTTIARSIDVAPTVAYVLGIPAPQQSQGRVLTEILYDGIPLQQVNLITYNDFHGQIEPTTVTLDGLSVNVGGAAYLATLFDEEKAALPGGTLILAGGDNVGASPPISSLLEDMPTIDSLNAWGLNATTFGNHEFDYGISRLLDQQAVANFSYLAANIIEDSTGLAPVWAKPSEVFDVNGVKVGVIGAALETTPELVKAGNVDGLTFLPALPAVIAESENLKAQGVLVQVLIVHEGMAKGQNRVGATAAVPWEGPLLTLVNGLQDTTIDVVAGGHTHWISDTMVGHILVVEDQNAGKDFTVTQIQTLAGEVVWATASTRLPTNLGVTPRADVKAIVDAANVATAPLRNVVIGTQQFDIMRDPTRLNESAMGNLIADATKVFYPEAEAAMVNSGGLRADIKCNPPSGGEQPCEITWGEMYAVLPFGNSTVIETLTGDQLKTAFLNGFSPKCNSAISTGRFPQVSGLKVTFHCNGTAPVVDGMWKTPDGPGGVEIPINPTDTIRIVINDFMATGGDGYTVLTQGTDQKWPGDLLLDVAIAYVTANSPVGPVVDGRVLFGTMLMGVFDTTHTYILTLPLIVR
jgi:2',3'-cyclic-nucleotide 2'-phosphodiesterase (5'-nucleotidase family)